MFDHLRKKAKSRRSAVGSALRSGRKGRGFESRRLDQKYGATAWLPRIFLSSLTGKSATTHYRGFARGARNEKLKKRTRIDERRRPALWAETRRSIFIKLLQNSFVYVIIL